jgi:hypothetical protein
MKEEWRGVFGLEDLYEVSNLGRVRNIKGLIMKQRTMRGYKLIRLSRSNKAFHKQVHRLVAEVFLPNPENKPQVDHKDTDRGNNKVTNLKWVTGSENIKHVFEVGHKDMKGEKNGGSKLTAREVLAIRMSAKSGMKQKDIAELFGITKATVSLIVNKKLWKHI